MLLLKLLISPHKLLTHLVFFTPFYVQFAISGFLGYLGLTNYIKEHQIYVGHGGFDKPKAVSTSLFIAAAVLACIGASKLLMRRRSQT
jgi:hypothetical protein